MKRFCVLLSILAILNMGVSIADAQRWIPDTNLRAAVRDALDLADGDRLTKAAIRDMTELSASRSQISDLTGLEFAKNVIKLELNGNSISDLSPLSGLENLTGLHIWSNDITDLSPLADMTQLEVLRFTKNSVSDLSALAGLVNLKRLSLKSNSVSDVSPLSGLESLEILHLAGNRITNTSVLAGLVSHLTEPLDIVVFPDRNLEVLVRESLRIFEGLANDEMLTPEFMALLTRVYAHTVTPVIRSLGGLEHATNLEELIFLNTQHARRDLTPLAGLAHLTRVELEGQSSALETLLTLPSLSTLRLRSAGLTDLTTLSELTGVRTLQLTFNGNLRDLTPLANMENLRRLTVVGSYRSSDPWDLTAADALSDISPLSALENLTYLSLDYNGISDLSALSALANLEELFLKHNNISDVSPLVGLTGLTKLRLLGNPVANAILLYPLTQQDTPVDIDIDVPEPAVIEVPDENLAASLRSALGLAEDADITEVDMLGVTSLYYFPSSLITDLTGLEYATNLTSLTFSGSPSASLTDISPLQGLTSLTSLNLDSNYQLSDLQPLAGLVNLKELNLWGNDIVDVSALTDLVNLEILMLASNNISDITALAGLVKLERLSLNGNDISDVSALSGLVDLLALSLRNNSIADVSPLANLVGLERLFISDNNIEDVSPLANLVGLERLFISENPVANAGVLYPLTQQDPPVAIDIDVSVIYIPDEKLAFALRHVLDLEADDNITIEEMQRLDSIFGAPADRPDDARVLVRRKPPRPVSHTYGVGLKQDRLHGINDLTGLEYATNLRFLHLYSVGDISDLSPIQNLSDLISLKLEGGEISDISLLSSNLESLSLPRNSIEDISPIEGLVDLEQLYLYDNNIEDISPLANLVNLEYLSLYDNNIEDISPLEGLVGLEWLYLANNPILDTSPIFPLLKANGGKIKPYAIDIEVIEPVIVEVPDTHLASELRRELGLASDADITAGDMARLISFYPDSEESITDLTGLEYALNITALILNSQTELNDLTQLSSLVTLTVLDLEDTSLTDLSFLENLVALTRLSLKGTGIVDVSPLASFVNLTNLGLQSNSIVDVSPLRSLVNLTILALQSNSIVDVSPLVDLVNLTYLGLFDNPILDTSPLYPLTQQDPPVDIDIEVVVPEVVSVPDANLASRLRRVLGLASDADITSGAMATLTRFGMEPGWFIGDLTGMEYAINLTSGSFSGGPNVSPTDLSPLQGITSLTSLTFIISGHSELTDITPLSGLVNLERLNLQQDGNIIDISALSGLINLEWLHLSDNSIIDISGLSNLSNLTTLYLASNAINDVNALSGLSNLTTLYLASNAINDVNALSGLSNLTYLSLLENAINDVSALSSLSNLEVLSLINNSISDVSPLSGLVNLTRLRLAGNPILDTSPLYPLTQQDPPVDIDIAVSQYAPWDVNEDGNVDTTDTTLVTAALGQGGADIVNSRTDVNGDDTVDADDLLLVTDNLDDAENASPATLSAIVNLVDPTVLESLDRNVLQAQLQILRAESDGSVKYQNAIALLEAFLAATRPEETVLLANYPNPFNPETWLPYHLANASNVRITIYDTRGVVVRRLDLGHQREGYYTSRSRAAYWDGRNHVGERVASGIYFYELAADDISLLRKMVILK